MPVTGPAMMPAANISTMAGILRRQASNCAPTPNTPTRAKAATGVRVSGVMAMRTFRSECGDRTETG